MTIETMPDVLGWNSGTGMLHRIYRSYLHLLSEKLGGLLSVLGHEDRALAAELDRLLQSASDAGFANVLTAPEMSYRLIWKPGRSLANGRFLRDALLAEQAREGKPVAFATGTWTALGDIFFRPDGEMLAQPRLPWKMPLDFGSPYALAADLGNGAPDAARPRFTEAETARVLRLLTDSCRRIGRVSPLVLNFAVDFNKVLVLQKDVTEPDGFTSGSTGQFVGRSFLVNPHLPTVEPVIVAEGIVHEAIHSLLYMQERVAPWVDSDALYFANQAVVSPWSGNSLALRPFMQACFVWYGLLQFWCLALDTGAFDEMRVRARITVALRGFLKGSLVDHLTPWRDGISAALLGTIAALQDNVMSARALSA